VSIDKSKKKDIVDAMMPALDVNFDPNFYCVSDRKWQKELRPPFGQLRFN
jgi:hypothetical protein